MNQRQLTNQNLKTKENCHTLTILVSCLVTKEIEIENDNPFLKCLFILKNQGCLKLINVVFAKKIRPQNIFP